VGQHGSAYGSILLDLDGFEVLAAVLAGGEWQLEVQTTVMVVGCPGCGVAAEPHGRRMVRVRVRRLQPRSAARRRYPAAGADHLRRVQGFWPPVADDPNFMPTHWEISRRNNAIEKVVVSDGISPSETEPWQASTRIVSRADATSRWPS
jgi:hypothetical protein